MTRPYFTFHPLLTLWIPAGFFILQCALEVFLPRDLMNAMVSENGPHELIEFMVAGAASLVAFRTLLLLNFRRDFALVLWVLAFALGCLYIAGEEISWGQWFFYWETPEGWSAINDQQETNLHNVSSWLDQKPKTLVLIGIGIGGLLFPLLERYTKTRLPERFRIIYPPANMLFVVLCIAAVKLSDLADNFLTEISLWARDSEIEEFFIFYYLLLYMIQLQGKIANRP